MDSLMNAGRHKIFLDFTKWIRVILKVIPNSALFWYFLHFVIPFLILFVKFVKI